MTYALLQKDRRTYNKVRWWPGCIFKGIEFLNCGGKKINPETEVKISPLLKVISEILSELGSKNSFPYRSVVIYIEVRLSFDKYFLGEDEKLL